MVMTQSEQEKKRRAARTGSTSGPTEPRVPEIDPAELESDQADSGPDRDRKELEG